MAKKVAFDRLHLPDKKFRVEHLLEWLGSGTQWIDRNVIVGAFDSEVEAMRL